MGWLSDVYTLCAVVGGTALVVQTVLLLIGGSHDAAADASSAADVDASHTDIVHAGEAAFVKWLSLKTLVALLTFFGLGGLAAGKAGLSEGASLAVALAAGAASVLIVGFLMASLTRLQSRGNVDLCNALGKTATVYLRIPTARSGRGKVTVEVQGRAIEVEAVTPGPEIPTGCTVKVTAVASEELLEVTRA
jgi:uncharacterized membrane protein